MTNEELNTALYEKMFAEQQRYREWLLSQPPDEILNHCYEFTVREDIVLALEYHDLSDKQCKALLQSRSPLADVFKDFEKRETDHMDNIENPDGKKKNYGEWIAEKNGKPTVRDTIRADIDRAILASTTEKDFIRVMEEMGYKIETKTETGAPRQHPIVILHGKKHFRLDKLGEFYELESIKQRIQNNIRKRVPFPEVKEDKKAPYYHYKEKAQKATGLYALYLYYCYELHIIVHKPASIKKVSVFLREDVTKLDQYIAQADFLGRTGITTTEELLSYKADKEALIKTLDNERKGLKNKQRQCSRRNDEKGAAEIKAQVDVITSEMSAIRKEIKLCAAIAERSARVQENLEDIRQQESERKEKTTDELLVRRSGRTSRENDPERG